MKSLTPTARSNVKQMRKRAHYDKYTLYAILDAGLVCHVGDGIGG